ncbi:MAG: hypothetical protein NC048_07425 [Bacteroides sp.]|nr:hypothetical protein [Ruminococcus flavefaciens]MCM1555310.1 hypothetical protein [Bacteroides sp.]
MTQLTLNIENPAVLPSLKKLLGFLDGVSIAKESKQAAKVTKKSTESEAILSAFRQVKSIKEGTIKVRSIDELLNEY